MACSGLIGFWTLSMMHGVLLPPVDSKLSKESWPLYCRGYMQGDGQLPAADDVTFK